LEYAEFLEHTGGRLRYLLELKRKLERPITLPELKEMNSFWFEDLNCKNYENSPLNPAFAVEAFGVDIGRYLSSFCWQVQTSMPDAALGNYNAVERLQRTWDSLKKTGIDDAADILRHFWREPDPAYLRYLIRQTLDPSMKAVRDIALTARIDDPSCLYRYGLKVDRVHIDVFDFIYSLSVKELRDISETFAAAYLEGLEEDNKLEFDRRTVSIFLPMGYERLVPFMEESFTARDLNPHFAKMTRTPINRQASYDHRFRYALYLDENSMDSAVESQREVMKELLPVLNGFSGNAMINLFGEQPFSPVPKPESVKPDKEVAALFNRMMNLLTAVRNEYLPFEQCSFCMMAFPSPEIEGDFKAIFKDTVRVNTLSNDEYRPIQKKIIDSLDGADHAVITGVPGNDTDLKVCIHPVSDPKTETAFENCVSSVNVPLGEVFTSPVLKGTNGTLHVEEAFIRGLKYDNIRLTFKDGYLTEWSCTNFADPEKCRSYVYENLIYPHDTLPLGEFAIGTNTQAYAMAVRHGIMGLLPVLILEKMGPHFAIGDTCYAHQEDVDHFDKLTGRKLIAVDNDKSALRHTAPEEAYTNTHTDVTLPYKSLGSITAIYNNGMSIDILKDGRFVLPGTEVLNEPLYKIM
jgi:aminopeptidase